MIDIHDSAAVERLRRQLQLDPHPLRRLRNAFYKRRLDGACAVAELPEASRERAAAELRFHTLTLERTANSTVDGATKLLFAADDGVRVESVILRSRTGRTALCISSQAGCGAGCAFCATGHSGLLRNLSSSEILDQVVQANRMLRDEGRRVRNIVLMGMGEPFHNEAAVGEALAVLGRTDCFDHTLRHVAVSTVGVPAAMERCARRFPQVRLALSLHSARAAVRQQLIPTARRCSLEELRDAVATVNELQARRQPVMVEYLMLAGWTDRPEDLDALLAWCQGLHVHLNLIPFNAIPEATDLHPTPRPEREAFANRLKARGHRVTLRYSLGADVTAACGQLARSGRSADRPLSGTECG